MTFKSSAAAACAAAALMVAQGAVAQTAQPAVTHGAPIAGLCTLHVEGAIGTSAVGKAVGARLQQLEAQVNAELGGERAPIEAENRAISAIPNINTEAVQNQNATRIRALSARVQAFEGKAQQRQQELGATEQKAYGRVAAEMEPLVRQVYQQKACAILLQRTAAILANPAMDITQQVVAALDAKITTLTFERERLEAQQPGAAAPRPAAPAAAPARR